MVVHQAIQRNFAVDLKTDMVKKVIYCMMLRVRGSDERRRAFKVTGTGEEKVSSLECSL
jgi:hypothetical protein